jgi:hypothetical protein
MGNGMDGDIAKCSRERERGVYTCIVCTLVDY